MYFNINAPIISQLTFTLLNNGEKEDIHVLSHMTVIFHNVFIHNINIVLVFIMSLSY